MVRRDIVLAVLLIGVGLVVAQETFDDAMIETTHIPGKVIPPDDIASET